MRFIISFIIILFLTSFSHLCYLMVFHWSLGERKSSKVSRTLLRILAGHINAVVWIILARSPISSTSSRLSKPEGIVPSLPIIIIITVTFTFNSFLFSSLARSKYLSFFLYFLRLSRWGLPDSKVHCSAVSLLFFFFVVVKYHKVSYYNCNKNYSYYYYYYLEHALGN